jgi:hypothetical protein
MTRLLSRAAAAAATLVATTVIGTAAPALAASATLHDPAGDADNAGLDITSARLRNLDHRVVVRVAFVRETRGDLVVSIDRRHGRGLRLVSEHHPAGTDQDFVLPGAFTDLTASRADSGHVRCAGFRVHWSARRPTARLVMPQSCLNGGNYGAVRFAVLTERGADTDFAPGDGDGSRWISRG